LSPKHIGGHDLDLSDQTRSLYVIGYMTIRFPMGRFLFASSDSISIRRTVGGHDLDLSDQTRSLDVIGYMAIRFPMGRFLFASSDSISIRCTV